MGRFVDILDQMVGTFSHSFTSSKQYRVQEHRGDVARGLKFRFERPEVTNIHSTNAKPTSDVRELTLVQFLVRVVLIEGCKRNLD